MPTLLRRHRHARLLVVGRVYYDVFLQRARELGVSHAVLAIGAVSRADVPDYLAAADVETHDLQGYGLGTASLESMAAGVPVVAAVHPDNFPGVHLVTGRDLVLVPVADPVALGTSLADLLGSPGLRARVGAAGQQLVRQRFSIAEVLRQHLEVLGRMTGR
jgi:glycosyltransferase involved in cell wall biosynthesis